MDYKKILNALYDISESWHGLVNAYGPYGNRYLFYGHLYSSIEECVEKVGIEEREVWNSDGIKKITDFVHHEVQDDFRAEMIDDEIVAEAKRIFLEEVNSFCKENKDGNLQSFFIGCALNLYYLSGLFDRCGYLDLNEIYRNIDDDVTKKYITMIELSMRKSIFSCFDNLCRLGLFEDKTSEVFELYLQASTVTEKEKYIDDLLKCVKQNANEVKPFVNSIMRKYDLFEVAGNEDRDLIEEMLSIQPQYQYAHLLRCMLSYKDYVESNGKDDSYLKPLMELYNLVTEEEKNRVMQWVLGHEKPSTFDAIFENNRIVTKHAESFSAFGLGVPYLSYISKDEYYAGFLPIDKEVIVNRKMITDSMKAYLSVPCEVRLDRKELLYSNAMEGLIAKKKLEKLQDERYRIIRDFSHTYDNMQAIGLKEIANILMECDDKKIQQCGRVILAEYGMKNSLKAEVNLLRLNFEDSNKELVNLIRQGVHTLKGETDNDIFEVFEEALKICLLRVIYSGNPRGEDEIAKVMFKRIKDKVGKMSEFVSAFENNVIIKGMKVSSFLRQYDVNIVIEPSKEWKTLYFVKNKHADVLLRSIFAELATNFLKYGDLNEDITFVLTKIGRDFEIKQENVFKDRIETTSGVGLESKGELLKKINGYQSVYINEQLNSEEKNRFQVKLVINEACLDFQEE